MMVAIDPSMITAFSPSGEGENSIEHRIHAGDDKTNPFSGHPFTSSLSLSSPDSFGNVTAGVQGAGQPCDLEHYRHRSSFLPSQENGVDRVQCDDGFELTTSSLPLRQSQLSTTISRTKHQQASERHHHKVLDSSSVSSCTPAHQQYGSVPSTSGTAAAAGSPIVHGCTSDLKAFKFPSVLPPPPKLKSVDSSSSNSSSSSSSVSYPPAANSSDIDEDMFSFAEMQANYLNMLNNDSAAEEASPVLGVLQTGLPENPFTFRHDAEDMRESPMGMQTSPLFASPHDDFLTTSGAVDPLQEFLTSPDFDTPYSEFLPTPDMGGNRALPHPSSACHENNGRGGEVYHTPVIGVGSGFDGSTSPLIPFHDSFNGHGAFMEDGPEHSSFGGKKAADYNNRIMENSHQLPPPSSNSPDSAATSPSVTTPSSSAAAMLQSANLYTMSPALEDLHDFSTATGHASFSTSGAKQTRSASSKYNGTRRNVTPSTLIPDDAPIQRRNYGQAQPTTAAPKRSSPRKRTASEAFDSSSIVSEAELETARQQGKISQADFKRIQNTLAARKSRKRKLQYQMDLEDKVELLEKSRDQWRERTKMLSGMLKAKGIDVPEFDYTV
jgi:hypothetical protein